MELTIFWLIFVIILPAVISYIAFSIGMKKMVSSMSGKQVIILYSVPLVLLVLVHSLLINF